MRSSMSNPEVSLIRDGDVAVLTLDDRARKNAMTVALGDALRARVEEVRAASWVRAVVLHGAAGTFSGGGDLAMLERLRAVPPSESERFMLDFYARYLSVVKLAVPTIAAVEGAAIGAGLAVAMACDVMVVDEDAKLALNFVQLGLHPGMGSTYLAPLRAGAMKGLELLMTGRRFDGREAAKLGIALEAVPAVDVLTRATALARSIARNAPLAVAGLKRGLAIDEEALARALAHEAREQSISYASADLGEGLRAAAERRTPTFVGS